MSKPTVTEWQERVIAAIREGKLSQETIDWIGDCLLLAWERGDVDDCVVDELEIVTRKGADNADSAARNAISKHNKN